MHSTTLKELSQLITGLKIPRSPIVMIHSSLLKFGIIENGVDGFLKCIIESLAGEPTIVMPAFTFSYFDISSDLFKNLSNFLIFIIILLIISIISSKNFEKPCKKFIENYL